MVLTSNLLKRVAAASRNYQKLSQQLTEAMRERYGSTHSDVDCDDLIESLDYGHGHAPTLRDCDKFMAEAGAPKIIDRASPAPAPPVHGKKTGD